jgi:hypothetical protein
MRAAPGQVCWALENRYGITLNRAWTEWVAEHGVSETIAVALYLMAKKIWPSPATLGCNSNVTVLLTLLQKPLHGMYFAVHRRRACAGRLRRDAHPPRFSAESFGSLSWLGRRMVVAVVRLPQISAVDCALKQR